MAARPPAPTANGSPTRRDEILAVAAKVFASRGIAASTVRDIADEAGILSGSLYHHFASKDQMVVEVLLPVIEEQQARYIEASKQIDDPVELVRRFIHIGVDGVARSPHTARIMHNESVQFQTNEPLLVVHETRQVTRRLWVSVLKRGARAGVFRKDLDADVAVRAIFDTVYSSARWLPPRGRSSTTKIATQLSQLFLDGLKAD